MFWLLYFGDNSVSLKKILALSSIYIFTSIKTKQLMKNILRLIVCALCLSALTLHAQSSLLDYWSFKDASDGDGLRDVNNSGRLKTEWNLNTKSEGDTVSSGKLGFTGDDKYTRRATSASSIGLNTLGTAFRFEVNFASWDLTNVAVNNKISFKLSEGKGGSSKNLAQVILEKNSATTARVRFSTRLSNGTQFYRDYPVSLSNNTAQTFAVEFLLDGKVNYIVDGTKVHTSTKNFGGVTKYKETLVVKDFSGEAGNVVKLNSFGFMN